jgi:hypothetical protein
VSNRGDISRAANNSTWQDAKNRNAVPRGNHTPSLVHICQKRPRICRKKPMKETYVPLLILYLCVTLAKFSVIGSAWFRLTVAGGGDKITLSVMVWGRTTATRSCPPSFRRYLYIFTSLKFSSIFPHHDEWKIEVWHSGVVQRQGNTTVTWGGAVGGGAADPANPWH